jgi:hypothetical protein
MIRRALTFFVALGLFAACSASDPEVDGTPAGLRCTPGPVSCTCRNGLATGTQTCDGQSLSPCVCPTKPAGASGGATGSGGSGNTPLPGRVCAELAGQRSCNATSYVSEQIPTSILFVVDRSGSMECNAPPVQTVANCNSNVKRADPSRPSRWEITVDALNETFTGFADSHIALGLSLFSSNGMCGVESKPEVALAPPRPAQLTALSAALDETAPAGGTPIVGGVITAYHHLHEEAHAPGNRYVVLITDGEESCGTKGDPTDDADIEAARKRLLETEVKKARDANIRTYVIGSPGSEGARGFLSELAFLGGTSRTAGCVHGDPAKGNCHFDLSGEADFAKVLKDTLATIGGKAFTCEFRVPTGKGEGVNVQWTHPNGGATTCFRQDPAPCDDGANGWQFAKDAAGKEDPSRVVLCGEACESVKAEPAAKVDIVLGCDVVR